MGHFDERMASVLAPDVREGLYSSNTYFMGVETEANRRLLARLAEATGVWPAGDGVLTNFGEGAYVCVRAFAAAANAAGSLESEALARALDTVEVDAPQGRVVMDPSVRHATVHGYLARCQADGSFSILERFGAIAPVLPERYRHERAGAAPSPDEDVRLQARMLAQLSEGVLLVHATAKEIVYANPGAERLFGYGAGELVRQPVARLAATDHEHDRMLEAVGRRGAWEGELHCARKDGTSLWCAVSASAFTHPLHGEVWLATYRDVTERRRLRDELEHEHAFATQLLETAPVLVLSLDQDGRIEHANSYFEELTGWRLDEVRGADWLERFVPDEDRGAERAALERARRGERVRAHVSTLRTRDGRPRAVEWHARAIRDGGGVVRGVLGVGVDVTERLAGEAERRRVEDSLRASEARLRQAQRIARIGNWELDLAKQSLVWSDEIFRIFELDPARFAPSYDAFLGAIHPDDRDAVNRAYSASLGDRIPYRITHRLRMPDGRVKHVEEQCETDFDERGTPLVSRGTVQDVTEKVHAEEELRSALREKEMLLREIHHRVKNNLQLIGSLLYFQSKKVGDPAGAAALEEVRQRLRAMVLVHEKLYHSNALSRIDFGEYLRALAHDLAQSAELSRRGIAVEVRSEPCELPVEAALPAGMIVTELLTNAGKYAFPEAGPAASASRSLARRGASCSP